MFASPPREAESTTLAEALDRYLSEVTSTKKGAKQEQVRIKKWKEHKLASKGLAAIRSSDMAAYRESVLAALQQAHLIKASDDDLLMLDLEGDDAMAQARDLLARTQATWLALTLGAKGATLLHRDGRAWHASETAPVTVADTVGAGDCFLAGLLVALLQRPSLPASPHADPLQLTDSEVRQLLAHAVASASLCVMQTGCVPPSLAEVTARLQTAPPAIHTC